MNSKRFTKIPIFKIQNSSSFEQKNESYNIERVIIFEDSDYERFIIIVSHKSNYSIIKIGDQSSNEVTVIKGNILEIIKQSNSEIKYNKFKNELYLIEYSSKPFIVFAIDDNYIHEIDLLSQKILRSISFSLSNSMNVQHSKELNSKQDHQRYCLERKMLLQSSIQIIPLNFDWLGIIQSRFQNYTFSQISIYDSSVELILRESIVGYRDKFDRGLFLATYMNKIDRLYFLQECILDEPIKILSLSLEDIYHLKSEENDQNKSESDQQGYSYLQRYLKKQGCKQYIQEKVTDKKYHHQIIDIQQIDEISLVIFMNSNERELSNDPCYLIYNTYKGCFNIEINFDNFEQPMVLKQVLSINQVNQNGIFQFISSNQIYTIEYDFNTKQITTLFCQQSPNYEFNLFEYGNKNISNSLSQYSSETSYYEIDQTQKVLYQRFSVGLSQSLFFLLQTKGITDYLAQISIHDVFEQLDLVDPPLE